MSFRRFLSSVSLLALVTAFAVPATAAKPTHKPLDPSNIAPKAPTSVKLPVKADTSPELRTITPRANAVPGPAREMTAPKSPSFSQSLPPQVDGVVQSTPGSEGVMPAPALTFEGGSNAENGALFGFIVAPPDTNGDVGPNHYVQTVNLHFSVYSKAGARLYGPAPVNTLWTGFGGLCESTNDGDPVVLYDQLADRWVISQFALGNENFQCVAVSQTGNPLGAYYRYAYNFGAVMNDYPKMGVWTNAYTLTANGFGHPATGYAGLIVAFQRDRMLAGLPTAAAVQWDLPTLGTEFWSILPVDADGAVPPPAGASPLFVNLTDGAQNIYGVDAMFGFRADINWANPAASLLSAYGVAVPAFTTLCPGTRNCIPQPGTSQKVDALSSRAMNRAVYRNFTTHQSVVLTHTVDAGAGVAGMRWYEVRQPNGLPWTTFTGANIYQASTYAPGDGLHRFMGSIAMDREGGMAVGYSVSSGSVSPGIRYAGRLANDTLNALNQTETTMFAGSGSQLSVNRWGDYSSMNVDPTDDCTFWYTQQYVATTGSYAWNTRVGAFKFPTCVSGATVSGGIQGTVTASGMPVMGALITVGGFTTSTDATGFYSLPNVPAGTYAAAAKKYGYNTATANPVITAGAVTTQNFVLTAATTVRVEGYVTDGLDHVYGLYAKITINAGGLFPGMTTYTDPLTGYFKVDLVPAEPGYPYYFYFESIYPGYLPRTIGPIALAANTVLSVPPETTVWLETAVGACTAPGYVKSAVTPVINETFDTTPAGTVPAGFTATSTDPSYPWQVDPVGFWGTTPYTAPNFLWFDSWNAAAGESARMFTTAPLDLTGKGVVLSFYMYHDTFLAGIPDLVQVQVSTDGGFNWQNVGAPILRANGQAAGWYKETVYVEGFTGSPASVLVGLQAVSAYGDEILVDNLALTTHNCVGIQGAMIVGNVYDANTGAALNEAMVSHDLGGSTYTFPTTGDPAQDDGFYFLFAPITGAPPAARNITASKGSYNSSSSTVIVPADGVIRLNFALTAGAFTISPDMIKIRTNAGTSASAPLTLQNGGTASATFSIAERILPPATYFPGVRPYGTSSFRAPEARPNPILLPNRTASLKNQPALDAAGIGPAYPGSARYGAVGVACDEMSYYVFGGYAGSASSAAYKYNVASGTWETLPSMPTPLYYSAAGCVNGVIYIAGGVTTGNLVTNTFLAYDTITNSWATSTIPEVRFAAAGAVSNGKFYIMGGLDDTFIWSTVWMFDPATGTFSSMAALPATRAYGAAAVKGQKIYFAGGINSSSAPQNSVFGYDSVANTWTTGPAMPEGRAYPLVFSYGDYLYVAGGESPSIVGTTIRYNPSTWPAGAWAAVPTAVLPLPVSDAAHVAVNNKLFVATGWAPGSVNVHQFIDDGLTTSQPADDLPYMTESPSSGSVGAGSSQVVSVNFDTNTSTKFGLHAAQLVVNNNTPYGPQAFGTLLTKAFLDVPEGAFGDREIHGLAGARITYGVAGNNYAPNNSVSRAEMAIFLTRATQGYAFIPPFPGPGMNSFTDVTYDHWAANYIEFIYNPAAHGAINSIPQLTTGCNASPLQYCPELPTTRGEMAIFITRAAYGGSQYLAPSPVFSDVPAGHPYRGFIERIWTEGVTGGCGSGLYCPDRAITRAEMAIFLVRAFNIPYLHH